MEEKKSEKSRDEGEKKTLAQQRVAERKLKLVRRRALLGY
jgi:hypothetical protein